MNIFNQGYLFLSLLRDYANELCRVKRDFKEIEKN